MPTDAPVNIGAAGGPVVRPFVRVSGMQAKLHRWTVADPGRRFDDLFNLVHDPATLMVAWQRVAGNTGARSARLDGRTAVGWASPLSLTGWCRRR
jgi:RNA-directed DNA polymerase